MEYTKTPCISSYWRIFLISFHCRYSSYVLIQEYLSADFSTRVSCSMYIDIIPAADKVSKLFTCDACDLSMDPVAFINEWKYYRTIFSTKTCMNVCTSNRTC